MGVKLDVEGGGFGDPFDRRLLWISVAVIGGIVLVSTPLHYLFPDLLRVPPPRGDGGFGVALTMEVMGLVMVSLCAMHCARTFGAYATLLFLLGSFVFTGALENLMVLGGRFGIVPFETFYYSSGGLTYFVEVPVSVCFGWFVFAYGSFFVAHTVFPRLNSLWSAAVAGLLCMNLDLWYDPVMANPANAAWTWLQPAGSTTTLFSIPLYNYPGWFGVICFFELLWVMARRWVPEVGKPRTTLRFFGGVIILIVAYLAMMIGLELLIRATLPHVNITFGGL